MRKMFFMAFLPFCFVSVWGDCEKLRNTGGIGQVPKVDTKNGTLKVISTVKDISFSTVSTAVVQLMEKNKFELQWPKPPLFNGNSAEKARAHLNEKRAAPYEQVVLGVMLENYSKFNLNNPTFHHGDCWYGSTREINHIRQVDSGSGYLFVVDNSALKGNICGSVSWQLNDGYKDLNVRLVLTFYVPWK